MSAILSTRRLGCRRVIRIWLLSEGLGPRGLKFLRVSRLIATWCGFLYGLMGLPKGYAR